MTHNDLVAYAARWCKSIGFSVVLTELKAVTDTGEIPDVLAFRNSTSMLVECKSSYNDFIADAKKKFRCSPGLGVGDWRFYFAPAGVIPETKLAEGWGLVELSEAGVVMRALGVPPNTLWISGKPFTGNKVAEVDILVSALRRVSK